MREKYLTSFARNLRRNHPDAERLLWSKIRNRKLSGVKFRRQQPIGKYIVDFVSFEKKLIIELDGGQHNENEIRDLDDKRGKWLKKQGYRILRFWDNDMLRNIDGVLEIIRRNVEIVS